MIHRRWAALIPASAAVALVLGNPAATGSTHGSALRFSHEVVVDEQRDGFEPDIQVAPHDRLYTSVPNGSSNTTSWLWTSDDHGASFHLVPGNLAGEGRTATCPQGGGDTEEVLDPRGDVFFSDLQNLSNLTNSVSRNNGKTFSTTCVGATNTPVDRMWYAVHGNLGDPGFRIYEEYDATFSSLPDAGNQLVLEASNNGTTWVPVLNTNPSGTNCVGGATNCVTNDEGISGNMVRAPNGDLLLAHTSSDSNLVIVSRASVSGSYPALTGSYKHTVINGSLCPDFPADSAHLNQSEICGSTNFATIAEDRAHHYYVMFASQRQTVENFGGSPTLVPSGPYEIYIAASLDGVHWRKPVRVSTAGSNAFPWITAGADGRVAAAWYSTTQTHGKQPSDTITALTGQPDPHGYLFDDLTHAEFNIKVAESLDARAAHPHYAVATVSEHPIKYGPICTQGLGCEVSMGDRSLGDFMQVNFDKRGAMVFSYVDDTSGFFSTGPTGAIADVGPPVVVRQVAGPGLLGGTIHGAAGGPSRVMGGVSDSTGDDVYSANSRLTPAGKNLDLTHASLSQTGKALVVHMKVASLKSLMVTPTAGGTTGEWITRFTTYDPHTDGNGHIYYVGMESVLGGKPRFFVGEPVKLEHQPFEAFNSSTSVPGSYDAKTGTITIKAPFAHLGNHRFKGTKLYSVTAFTATSAASLAHLPTSLFNVVDSTPPYGYVLLRTSSTGSTGSGSTGGSSNGQGSANGSSGSSSGSGLAATGGLGAPLAALFLTAVALLIRSRRRRSATPPG